MDTTSRPGNGWDGHLPSSKLERAILNSIEGIEDEDGKVNGLLKQDTDEMTVFRQRRVNTGPKGVKEDAKRYYAMKALMAQAEAVATAEMIKRKAITCKPVESEDDEDDDEDEDDEEFRRYKLERLREMQQKAHSSAQMPTFGAVETIKALDMPTAIDTVGSQQSFVVVHLQEDYLAACVRLSFKLGELASKYDQVRFLNVSASDAKPDLDPATLPILIAYQDGKFLASAERVGKDEGDSLTADEVEQHLLRLGVRPTASAAMKAADAAALRRLRELDLGSTTAGRAGDEEDEDDESHSEEEEEEEEAMRRAGRGKGMRLVSLS